MKKALRIWNQDTVTSVSNAVNSCCTFHKPNTAMDEKEINVKIIVKGYFENIRLAKAIKTIVTTTIGKMVSIASIHLKVMAALPSKTRWVKSFAKILMEPPACSKAKKKKILAIINTPTTKSLSLTTWRGVCSSSCSSSSF